MPRKSIEEALQERGQLNPKAAQGAPRPGFDVAAYQAALATKEAELGSSGEKDSDGFLLDTAQGLAKSVGDIGLGIGSFGRKIQGGISKGIDKVFGTEGFGLSNESIFDKEGSKREAAENLLERDTAGEKFGGFVGDVASFALPGGAAVRAQKGAGLARKAVTLGASDAGVTAIREGEVDRSSLDAFIIGAAFPVVGRGASAAKRAIIPSGADAGGKVINSLIKPLLKDFSYGKNPGKAVAEAGITGSTLEEIGQKITVARQNVGNEIGNVVKQSDMIFDASKALDPLDAAIAEANKSPRTNAEIIRRLQNLKADLLGVGEDGLPTRKLENLTADELWELKKDVGALTRWTGNATDDEIVNKGLKQTYGALKGQMDEIEGLSELNEKWANLMSAEIATNYRDKIAARQNLISFSGGQTGIAAGLVTAAATGGVTAPLLVGASAGALMEASKSPAFKTKLAAWLASASREELEQAFTQAPWLRGTLQSILLGEEGVEDESSDS